MLRSVFSKMAALLRGTFIAVSALGAAALQDEQLAAAGVKQLLHVRLPAPGHYEDVGTTVDAAGQPSFVFSAGVYPPSQSRTTARGTCAGPS